MLISVFKTVTRDTVFVIIKIQCWEDGSYCFVSALRGEPLLAHTAQPDTAVIVSRPSKVQLQFHS